MEKINITKNILTDLKFLLYEQFGLEGMLDSPLYEEWDRETCDLSLEEAFKFTNEVWVPTFEPADKNPPVFNAGSGTVTLPSALKEAYQKTVDLGWQTMGLSEKHDGQGAPYSLVTAVYELFSGAGPSLFMYLTAPLAVIDIIDNYGTEEQKNFWIPNLASGKWNATMVLTEPEAGSDVGSITTKATKQDDGSYLIKGRKIFISNGEHDLNENIIHMVLARPENAPPGSKGLSLFIVPKMRVNPDTTTSETANDVICGGIEDKMGIHGSATCSLYFGENDSCRGFIVGDGTEGLGLRQMFTMMNEARIITGLMANAQAARAYYSAVDYARERIQGFKIDAAKKDNSSRVPIIEHPDVKRMLLEMKAVTEAGRALILKLCSHEDLARILRDKEPQNAEFHSRQVDLLTPLVKAHLSDQAWRVCELAIQTHGGYGYISDYPVEQYTRNVKILSIYEGTNHIQALDFVLRKLPANKGRDFNRLLQDIKEFIEKNKDHPVLSEEISVLDSMLQKVINTTYLLQSWNNEKDITLIPAYANYYLEMVSLVTCGQLILESGVIAAQKLQESPADRHFYEGKIASAQFYCRHILSKISSIEDIFKFKDRTCIEAGEKIF